MPLRRGDGLQALRRALDEGDFLRPGAEQAGGLAARPLGGAVQGDVVRRGVAGRDVDEVMCQLPEGLFGLNRQEPDTSGVEESPVARAGEAVAGGRNVHGPDS